MAKICPISKEQVLYLDCLDCDEKTSCQNNTSKTTNKKDIFDSDNLSSKQTDKGH